MHVRLMNFKSMPFACLCTMKDILVIGNCQWRAGSLVMCPVADVLLNHDPSALQSLQPCGLAALRHMTSPAPHVVPPEATPHGQQPQQPAMMARQHRMLQMAEQRKRKEPGCQPPSKAADHPPKKSRRGGAGVPSTCSIRSLVKKGTHSRSG